MTTVIMACPTCGFVIADFTEEQMAAEKRVAKRYQYLKKKQTLCPNCLIATKRLKELRGAEADEAKAAAPTFSGETHLPEEAEGAEGVAPTTHLPEEAEGVEAAETPILDELENGPWPSHVTELKKSKYHMMMYEEGMRLRQTQWGFGGYVSLPGVAAGLLVRASARPDIAKGANFMRMLAPSGGYYTTDMLRTVCDITDEHAYGLLHLHSAGGDIEILGIPTEDLEPTVKALNEHGFDVGSTSDAYRNSVDCLGMSRCDAALMDSMGMRDVWYKRYLDDVQYPRFPHKLKVRFSGCPNDCARAQQKSGIAIIGVFRDLPRVDGDRLTEWVGRGGDMNAIVRMCPTRAMIWDGKSLEIDADSCVRCMFCINKCSYAIQTGVDRGVAIVVGAKFRGKYGPLLGKVLTPFVPANPPDYNEIFDIADKVAEAFDEHARRKERLGDMIFRVGMDKFTEWVGVEPSPRQLAEPRTNVYYHWTAEELSR